MNTQTKPLSRISSLRRASTLAVVILIAGLTSRPLQADDAAPDNGNSDTSFRSYVELLRADLKTGKVAIYNHVMELGDTEAKIFWPVYQQYETELFALGDRRLVLIKKFANAYNNQTLDNTTAKKLTKDWFAYQEDRIKLWKKYQRRIERKLNATRAAQFLQIENRINALLDLMIASEIPLIDPAAGAKAVATKP